MSNRDIKKYISVLRKKIKVAIRCLNMELPDSEGFRTLCVNINNMDMTIRQYKDLLELNKKDNNN